MLEPFLLGLSSGTVCLAYCAPVLVPYLLGEGGNVGRDALVLTEFLMGRLAGYVLFALAAWLIGFNLLPPGGWRDLVFGLAYLVLSVLLIGYGFLTPRGWCAVRAVPRLVGRLALPRRQADAAPSSRSLQSPSPAASAPAKSAPTAISPAVLPLALGFLTGINVCPPFLIALARAADARSALGSVRFFVVFFLGTAVYFVPMPLLGALRPLRVLQTVGRMAAGIIGIYYFYLGLVTFYGGIRLL